jgi:hypothetical protein
VSEASNTTPRKAAPATAAAKTDPSTAAAKAAPAPVDPMIGTKIAIGSHWVSLPDGSQYEVDPKTGTLIRRYC